MVAAKKSVRKQSIGASFVTNQGTIYNIPLSRCYVAGGYQRELRLSQIRSIAETFNWDAVGIPVIANMDENDMFPIIDGQHRWESLKLVYPDGVDEKGDILTWGVLIPSVSNGREFELFTKLNNPQTRKPVSPNDIFKANMAGGAIAESNIVRVLSKHGIAVGFGPGGSPLGMTKHPAAFRDLYVSCGSVDKFDAMVQVLCLCFARPDDDTIVEAAALQATFLRGLAQFVRSTSVAPVKVMTALSLSAVSAADIVQRAAKMYGSSRYSQLAAVGYVIERIVEHGLASRSGVIKPSSKLSIAAMTPKPPKGKLKAASRPASPLKPKAKKKKAAKRRTA